MTDETSADEIGTQEASASTTTKSRKPGKNLVSILTAGALVLACGITAVSMSAANAAAEETACRCAVALESSESASKGATASLEKADEALEAIEAVPAVEASDGVVAVVAVEAIPARASGAWHIVSVTDAREALAKIKLPTGCVQRDEAAAITALTAEAKKATKMLDTSVAALLDDFAAFQTDETARIAAEIEAARVAAEAAAAAEAERQRAAASTNTWGGSKSGGGSSGGSYTRPPGGGGIGVPPGANNGVCWGSNGMGGLVQVPCP